MTTAFQINPPTGDARRLTQAIIQVTDILGMYRAELARVIGCRCGDIGRLDSAQELLQPGSSEWGNAELFVAFYRLLYEACSGDGVQMRHWLHAENADLGKSPHRLIVDHASLAQVVAYLETRPRLDRPRGGQNNTPH